VTPCRCSPWRTESIISRAHKCHKILFTFTVAQKLSGWVRFGRPSLKISAVTLTIRSRLSSFPERPKEETHNRSSLTDLNVSRICISISLLGSPPTVFIAPIFSRGRTICERSANDPEGGPSSLNDDRYVDTENPSVHLPLYKKKIAVPYCTSPHLYVQQQQQPPTDSRMSLPQM